MYTVFWFNKQNEFEKFDGIFYSGLKLDRTGVNKNFKKTRPSNF